MLLLRSRLQQNHLVTGKVTVCGVYGPCAKLFRCFCESHGSGNQNKNDSLGYVFHVISSHRSIECECRITIMCYTATTFWSHSPAVMVMPWELLWNLWELLVDLQAST